MDDVVSFSIPIPVSRHAIPEREIQPGWERTTFTIDGGWPGNRVTYEVHAEPKHLRRLCACIERGVGDPIQIIHDFVKRRGAMSFTLG